MRNECTILEAKNEVKNGIRAYLMKGPDGKYLFREENRLPYYFEGAPGLGKTEVSRQIANELGIGFVSFSLTHHTRNSLLGLPVICNFNEGESSEGKYTSYTMSEVLAKVYEEKKKGYEEGILLLDEFPCMSQTIMPTMLAFLQTKNIGTHVLPEGWIIILCGNPPEYNDHSIKFDAAIRDRIRTISVRWDEQVFLDYAKKQGFHESIMDYLEIYPNHIYRCDDTSLVTCRGWENLSHTIKGYEAISAEISYTMIRQFIKSDEIAESFQQYYRKRMGLKREDVLNIISGENVKDLTKKYDGQEGNVKLNLLNITEEFLQKNLQSVLYLEKGIQWYGKIFKKIKAMAKDKEKELPLSLFGMCLYHIDIAKTMHPELKKLLEFEDEKAFLWLQSASKDLFTAGENAPKKKETYSVGAYEKQCKKLDAFLKSKKTELSGKRKELSEKSGNVFRFFGGLSSGEIYTERFFYFVNQNSVLLNVMADSKCQEYLDVCEKMYIA